MTPQAFVKALDAEPARAYAALQTVEIATAMQRLARRAPDVAHAPGC